MSDRVWISWNEQRRNIGLAAAVNARLYITDRDAPGGRRLITEFFDSWKIVRRERPSVCFTMNPSIFSSWWLSLLARIYKFRLVTDLHTVNIKLTGLKKIFFKIIFNSGIRRSDLVIVTNSIYREVILKLNKNVAIVPDALPELTAKAEEPLNGLKKANNKIQVILVSSFDDDEPIDEVLTIDPDLDGLEILITGNWRKRFDALPQTRNIRFLGFVNNEEYERLLLSVDGVMVLTKSEGCLCCGAYEAFSAGKPLILSRTKALQSYFGASPVYTENDSASILSALGKLKAEKDERAGMIAQERPVLTMKFKKSIENLENILSGLTCTEQ